MLFEQAAVRTSAGSCLPDSNRDLKKVCHISLRLFRNCSPGGSQRRPTPRVRGRCWCVRNWSNVGSHNGDKKGKKNN